MSDMQDPLELAEHWKPVTGHEGTYDVSNHDASTNRKKGPVRALI